VNLGFKEVHWSIDCDEKTGLLLNFVTQNKVNLKEGRRKISKNKK